MTLRPFDPGLASDLARLYNDALAGVPETCPAPEAWFADPCALRSVHYALETQELMLAEEGGAVVGFVHVALAPPATEEWHPREAAAIRALVYRPGQRRAGQALLEWAEAWARERARRELIAWHALYGYPCQSPWTHLSDRVGHVRALFGMAGYTPYQGQTYLVWRDYTPPAVPPLEVDCTVTGEWQEGFTGPRWLLTARQGEVWLGDCRMDRGHASPLADADDWCYCAGLTVADEYQGRRLGLHLLNRGLQDMHAAGCRHADISTLGDNYRAELFYTNLGYRSVDYSEAWRKELRA